MSKLKLQSGIVVSNNMDKSIVVKIERKIKHPIYKKTIKRSKKYVSHDENNDCQIGALVQIGCETDFVARTDEVKELSHNIAMQVAAMNPRFISKSDIPKSEEEDSSAICLLEQQYIKDQSITIQDLLNDVIAKVGENIQVTRITRFALE